MKILKIKVSSRDDLKKHLVHAYNEKCFFVHNGPALSNLSELLRALNSMTERQFAHHVNADKNDFAAWVEFVLLDKDCAAGLKRAGDRKKAAAVVEKALREYQV